MANIYQYVDARNMIKQTNRCLLMLKVLRFFSKVNFIKNYFEKNDGKNLNKWVGFWVNKM